MACCCGCWGVDYYVDYCDELSVDGVDGVLKEVELDESVEGDGDEFEF